MASGHVAETSCNAPSGMNEASAKSFAFGGGSSVRKASGGSQPNNSGTVARNSSRSWKDMLEIVKKLHNNADNLQEKISRLHCKWFKSIFRLEILRLFYVCSSQFVIMMFRFKGDFADLTLRATCLFDGTTVQILTDDCPEIGGIPSPEEIYFTRQEVGDAYADLSQILSLREARAEPEL